MGHRADLGDIFVIYSEKVRTLLGLICCTRGGVESESEPDRIKFGGHLISRSRKKELRKSLWKAREKASQHKFYKYLFYTLSQFQPHAFHFRPLFLSLWYKQINNSRRAFACSVVVLWFNSLCERRDNHYYYVCQ